MRSVPVIVALVTFVAALGGAAAQSSYQYGDGTAPSSPPPKIALRIWVDGFDVVSFRGPDVWVEHREGPNRPTNADGTLHLNGRTWLPSFAPNATCPCKSNLYTMPEGYSPPDPQLFVQQARGGVKLMHDATGGFSLAFDDLGYPGGAWYSLEVHPGRNAHPPGDDRVKIRVLADGFLTIALKEKSGWLEVPATEKIPTTNEPILYFDGEPVRVTFANQTNTAACPCRSNIFPLPFTDPNDEGVPADARGAIFHYEGRGSVKILEQPADGNGIFRLGVDDSQFANPAWYTIEIGGDPAYHPMNDNCYAKPYADGTYPETYPCGAPCPAPPPESRNWTQAEHDRWHAERCGAPPPCSPPPEARYWTEDQRRQWFGTNCPGPAPAQPACMPPPEARGWTEEQRHNWYATQCNAPCSFPPEAYQWSNEERHKWVQSHCPAPSNCPPPPYEAQYWSAEEKQRYFEEKCRHEYKNDDPLRQVADALKNNKTLQDEARKAAENATGQKIVVPGFEVLYVLGGLGAVGALYGRRMRK